MGTAERKGKKETAATALFVLTGACLIALGILISSGKITLYIEGAPTYNHVEDSAVMVPATDTGWRAATSIYIYAAGAFIIIAGIRGKRNVYAGAKDE